MTVPGLLRVLSVGLLLTAAPAQAQNEHFEHRRASFYVGAFVTDRDTETRLDSENTGAGSDVDWESDLGLESKMAVIRVGGNIWFKPRQRFDFSLFDLSRSTTDPVQDTIMFGDAIFVVDTVLDSTFDLTIAKADYTFAALSRPKGYLGVNAGLYIASTKVSLSETSGLSAESQSLTAPLPVVGIRGEFRVTENITLNGAFQWFRIETGDAGGRLRDAFIGADYRLGSRWDIGLGYNDVGMNIDAKEEGGLSGRLDWGYDGWLIYSRANFGDRN